MNGIKTAMLIAALTALFMGVGYLVGGPRGATVAFAVAALMNLFSYWNADKIVLRMHGATEVDERSAPELVRLVRQLAQKADLPMPRVYVIDNPQPNAFATGRNPQNAAVAVTTGLLASLTREELAGVIAHELAHIEHRDTLTMTATATLAGAISMIANFGFLFGGNRNSPYGAIGVLLAVITAPFAAMLVQMAVSRTREYSADRRAAEITGAPMWLASALSKIARQARRLPMWTAERNPATAHLFIVNPLSGARMDNLFSTHPAPENRIAALAEIEREMAEAGRLEAQPRRSLGSAPADPRGPWTPPASGGASRHNPRAGVPDTGRRTRRGPWG